MRYFYWLCCFYSLAWSSLFGQLRGEQIGLALEAGDYLGVYEAVLLRQKAKQIKPMEQYWGGVAAYRLGHYHRARAWFDAYLKGTKRPKPEALLWAGKTYQILGRSGSAAWYFRTLLQMLMRGSLAWEARLRLEQCERPRFWLNREVLVKSWGEEVNGCFDDFLMLSNPRFPQLGFFSSNRPLELGGVGARIWQEQRGKVAVLEGGRYGGGFWGLADFIDGGYQVLLNGLSGGLMVDNFDLGDSLALRMVWGLGTAANPQVWEGGGLVLFSARGSGGYGGRDIFFSYKDSAGHWSEPRPLGRGVNTVYDEDCPFLAPDGKTLFFSSFRPQGWGGYDVYRSVFEDSCRCWSEAELLGLGINSWGDDLYFRLGAGGEWGQVSSQREGGRGGLDLYRLYFAQTWTEGEAWGGGGFWAWLLGLNQNQGPKPEHWAMSQSLGDWRVFYPQKQQSQTWSSRWEACPQARLLAQVYGIQNLGQQQAQALVLLNQAENLLQSLQQREGWPPQLSQIQILNWDSLQYKRIEFEVLAPPHCPDYPNQWPNQQAWRQQYQGLSFSIEILNSKDWLILPEVQDQQELFWILQNQTLHHCLYHAKDWNQLLPQLKFWQEQGFENSRIIALYNGALLQKHEALSLSQDFPNLAALLASAWNH